MNRLVFGKNLAMARWPEVARVPVARWLCASMLPCLWVVGLAIVTGLPFGTAGFLLGCGLSMVALVAAYVLRAGPQGASAWRLICGSMGLVGASALLYALRGGTAAAWVMF